MKAYIMELTENGPPVFIDEMDRISYKRTLSTLRGKGVTRIRMIIEVYDGKLTSDAQRKLWLTFVGLIQLESGNDRDTINETLLHNFQKEPEQMNNVEFNALLDYSFSMAKEFFNVSLTLSKEGLIEQDNTQ